MSYFHALDRIIQHSKQHHKELQSSRLKVLYMDFETKFQIAHSSFKQEFSNRYNEF